MLFAQNAPAPRASSGDPPWMVSVDPIPEQLRTEYRLNPFYKKSAMIDGIPIVGSQNVSDFAFRECAWTIHHMLDGRTVALDALVKAKVRIGIIAVTEYTMDIPENQNARMMANAAFNDRRSRGLGGLPLATCAEENLLNLRGDPYSAENITIHEFSHTVASAMRRAQPAWYEKLRDAYKQAMATGGYGTSYAATNEQEYWAEGAQCWFGWANPRNTGGAANRDDVKKKDPALAALLNEIYGDGPWRYFKTSNASRAPEDLVHLAGFDRMKMPAFSFNNSPRVQAAATQPGLNRPPPLTGRRGATGATTVPATRPARER
jgi:alpha-glucosidase